MVARLFEGGAADGAATSLLYLGSDSYAHEFGWLIEAPREPLPPPLFRGSWLGALRDPKVGLASAGADVVVRQGVFGAGRGDSELILKPYLSGHLPLAASVGEQIARVRSKAHRRRMRTVLRSRDHRFVAGTDASNFELFYSRMYAPYVRARFGLRGRLDTREALLSLRPTTLLVFDGSAPVCGTLLLPPTRDGVLGYHRNGFSGAGDLSPARLARWTAALEVSVFQYAQSLGCRALDLGHTRAILNDGLFVHKRRLGCSFEPADYSPTFHLRLRAGARARVLAGLPLACVEGKGFVAHVGYQRGTPLRTPRRWRPVVKNYAFAGVGRVVVHTDASPADPGRCAFEEALRRALGRVPVEIVAEEAEERA